MVSRAMAAATCALLLGGAAVSAQADDYPLDQVIVRLSPGGSLANILSAWNATVLDSVPGYRIYLLHLNDPALQDSMTIDLDDDAESRYCDYNSTGENAEARRQIVVIAIGDSTDVVDQDAFARVRTGLAHAYTRGAGSRVALLDTGVDLAHPFLAGRFDLAAGYDFVDDDGDPSDTGNGVDDDADGQTDEGFGHGTMVAGIVKSIAPEATLIPIRVLDDEGRGSVFAVLQGIYRAYDAGATIVNVSLGTTGTVDAISDALEEMELRGVSVVAAAGNDSTNTLEYPARDSKAFAVTAVDSLDVKAEFANYSSDIELSAPGVGVFSAYRNGGYGQGAGTSFSAPFASGALALLRSLFPSMSPTAHRTLLEAGAAPIDGIPGNELWQGELGAGRIDCYGAIVSGFGPTGVPGGADRPRPRVLLVPNPARAGATIRFDLSAPAHVVADVFSADGRRVRTVDLGARAAGTQQAFLRLDVAPARYAVVVRAAEPGGRSIVLDAVSLIVMR